MHQKNLSFVTTVFFKDIRFKFEEHVCNGCHDLLTTAYSLENIAILNAKELLLVVFCGVLVGFKKIKQFCFRR